MNATATTSTNLNMDENTIKELFATIFLYSYKIISVIKHSKDGNTVNILLETSPFLNAVKAGMDRFLNSCYFYFKVIKEDIKYTRVYENESGGGLNSTGEININITGTDFIEKMAKIFLMDTSGSEIIPEDVIQQLQDVLRQILIPITKEEYESLIGQEVTG